MIIPGIKLDARKAIKVGRFFTGYDGKIDRNHQGTGRLATAGLRTSLDFAKPEPAVAVQNLRELSKPVLLKCEKY
jgi:hypothetical protein